MTERSSLSARLKARVGNLVLDLALELGAETLVLVGPNGAGKSTTLSLVLGAKRPERGSVRIGGDTLFDSERGLDVPIESRRLGYVPQNYALFPHLSVRENLAFGPRSGDARDLEARVDRVIERFALGALESRRVRNLSGGEQQRVALARALAVEPRALLLDEPLGALDPHARDEVRETLRATLDELELPTLLVTHDATDAQRLGARVAVLESGKITQLGSFAELAATPASHFVEQFTRR